MTKPFVTYSCTFIGPHAREMYQRSVLRLKSSMTRSHGIVVAVKESVSLISKSKHMHEARAH